MKRVGRGSALTCALLLWGVSATGAAASELGDALGEGVREQSCAVLAASTVGVPDVVRVDPVQGIPRSWPKAGGGLPERVDFRTPRETFNRLYEFALRKGQIYARGRQSGDPWRRMPLPACIAGRVKAISVDDDEMIALDSARRIFTMDNALKDGALFNWSFRWGTPFWLGLGWALPPGLDAWAWSVISPVEDKTWTDPAGNRTAVGSGKVSHIWGLRRGGRRLTFWDPWLPHDQSYEACGPERGRFRAVSMNASGSHLFVMSRRGDMFTRLYDFDISGHDPVFFSYSYDDQRGRGDGAPIQLPAEPWTEQPKIPGLITDRISIAKTGTGAIHAILRVEGARGGSTGYWERDLASPRSAGWRFMKTGEPLAGAPLENTRRDTSRKGLAAGEDERYEMRTDRGKVTLADYNVYCSPARLTERVDGHLMRMRLHYADGLRQQPRSRGLDDVPRAQAGAIEGPRGHFEEVTINATRDAIEIPERGWVLNRVR